MQLFQRSDRNPYPEDDYRFFLLGCCSGGCDLAVVSAFQRLVASSLYSLPARNRLELARAYCCVSLSGNHPDSGIVKYLIKGDKSLLYADMSQSIWEGLSIIHTIAISFGRVYRMVGGSTKRCGGERLAQWRQLAANAIALSKPFMLHYVETVHNNYSVEVCQQAPKGEWVGTPLLSLLKGCSLDWFEGPGGDLVRVKEMWQHITSFALAGWLERLTSCGIDLGEYGREEKGIFNQAVGRMAGSFSFALSFGYWDASEQKHVSRSLVAQLRGFEYGSDLADWFLVWEIDGQSATATCGPKNGSQLLPDAELAIPGAWVE